VTYALGRLLEHDERSRAFQAAASPVLRTVTHAHFGATLDQGNTGSCTGHAAAHALATRPMYQKRQYTHDDAMRFYSLGTQNDQWIGNEYPPTDDGSSALGVCKGLMILGEISSYTHAFGLTHTLGATVNGPVMIGVNFYEDMAKLNKAGFMIPGGDILGGHEMCLVGINTAGNYVTGINSWGPGWGRNGRFKMAFSDLGRLLSEDGDATVAVR
jgi:C1A family cysteine protease